MRSLERVVKERIGGGEGVVKERRGGGEGGSKVSCMSTKCLCYQNKKICCLV